MTGVVSKKMGIREDSRAYLVNASQEAVAAIALPDIKAQQLLGF